MTPLDADPVDEIVTPVEALPPIEPIRSQRARAPRFGWLAPHSKAPITFGIVLTIAGFAALAYTWARVAGTAIVALQLPYIASGGAAGLGLIVVGILAISLGARRRDAWQRDRRLEELAAILERDLEADAEEEPSP